MTDASMKSDLRYSELLGRKIRTGDAGSLGVPTEDLALAALADGDVDSAREYFEYSVDEKARVRAIFDTWLDALLAYGRAELPGLEAEVERLTDLIGMPPPTDAATLGHAHTERASAALEHGDRAEFEAALREQREAALTLHDAQADWAWGLLSSLRNGLGEVEQRALDGIEAGATDFATLFLRFDQSPPRFGFGDGEFLRHLRRLATCAVPMITITEAENETPPKALFALTPAGKNVLDGKVDFIELNNAGFWLGGAHLTRARLWRWDGDGRRIVSQPAG